MTPPPPKIPSLFELLMSAAASAAHAKADAAKPPWPANPFPCGIRSGSVTDKVLAELQRVAPQALDHGQLRHRCQAGRGGVSWAVAFLQHLGKVEAITDPRQTNYARYRAVSPAPTFSRGPGDES